MTNIWAGIGAKRWAVSEKQATNASIRTKSKRLPVGALGLIYCVESKALTTPVVVTSAAEQTEVVVNVWPQKWMLPFGIVPLGSPHKSISTTDLPKLIPSLAGGAVGWNNLFYVTPTMVFTPSKLTDADWAALLTVLLE